MPAAKKSGVYRCHTQFFAQDKKGVAMQAAQDELVSADDPRVKAYPGFFEPVEMSLGPPHVEQATAAPGEKRA